MSLIDERLIFSFVAGIEMFVPLSPLHNANEVADKDAKHAKPRAFAAVKGLLALWALQLSRGAAAFLSHKCANAEDERVISDRWRDSVRHLMVDDAMDWTRSSPLFMVMYAPGDRR